MCAEDMVDTTWSSVDGRMWDEKARPARNNAYYGHKAACRYDCIAARYIRR